MNNNRRTFLKILLVGGGTMIVGKILGPLFSKFSGTPLAKNNDVPFRIEGDHENFSVYDENGHEVFQVDNGE